MKKKNTIRNQEALTNEKHNQLEDISISISKTRSRRGQWWWTRRWKNLRHPIHNLRLQFTDRWFTICILRVLLLVAGRFTSLVRSGKISDDSLASGLGALPISLLLSLCAAGCPHSPRCPFLWLRRRLVRLPRNPQVQRMEIIMLITTNQEAPQERLLCKNDYYIDVNFLLSADKYETMKYLPLKLPMTV